MRLPLFSPSVIKFVVSCKLARVGLLSAAAAAAAGPVAPSDKNVHNSRLCPNFPKLPESCKKL